MTNSQRNIAIVFVAVLFASVAGAQSGSGGALVQAIDRGTRAQIRTCEATWVSGPFRSWDLARRCWR